MKYLIARRISLGTMLLALLAGLPVLAQAHTGTQAGDHHGFMSGLIHPLTGFDHLAAMLAVGVWGALTARSPRLQDILHAPAAFACLLLAGAMLAAAGVSLPGVEPMIAVSLLILGLLVAARRGLHPVVGVLFVGTFALFHGGAHGSELSGNQALAGMVLATALLHAVGLAIGRALRQRSDWLPRVLGGSVAAFGAALLVA